MGEAFRTAVYLLCFLTSAACAVLLARSYLRTHARLLLWSALSFGLLAINNGMVILDLVVIDWMSLQIPRLLVSLCSVGILLFGFIWDLEE